MFRKDATMTDQETTQLQEELHAFEEAFEEIIKGRSVVTTATGEVVDVFDPSVDLPLLADAAAYLISSLTFDIEYLDSRILKYKQKKDATLQAIESIKASIADKMKYRGETKVKGHDATFYFRTTKKYIYDLRTLPLAAHKVKVTLSLDGTKAALIKEQFGDIAKMEEPTLDKAALPSLLDAGMIQEIEHQTLCLR